MLPNCNDVTVADKILKNLHLIQVHNSSDYSTNEVYLMMTLLKINEGSLTSVLSWSDKNETLGTHQPPSIYRLADVTQRSQE